MPTVRRENGTLAELVAGLFVQGGRSLLTSVLESRYIRFMKTKQEILTAAKSSWTKSTLEPMLAGSSKKVTK